MFTIDDCKLFYTDCNRNDLTAFKNAVKFQIKFSLTLENLKCLNPDCNKIRKWNNSGSGFALTCGLKICKDETCELRRKIANKKAKDTWLKKYGTDNPSKSKVIKQKKQETFLKNCGYSHNMKDPECLKKRESKSLEIYGVRNPSMLDTVKLKLKKTKQEMSNEQHLQRLDKFKTSSLIKFGVENPSQSEVIKQKIKNTNFLKFGANNPFLNLKIRDQINKNRLLNTGYINPFNDPKIKKQIKNYYINNYGCTSNTNIHIKNFEYWYDKEFWINNFQNVDKTINYIKGMNFFGCSVARFFQKLKTLGIIYKKSTGSSISEKEIGEFINKKFNVQIIKNERYSDINELDIYIPAYKLAIEYNGLYWHSYLSNGREISPKQTDYDFCKQRHIVKTKACEKRGIKLLHIFENEWLDPIKQNIWKSIIGNYLDKNLLLDSDNFYITEIESNIAEQFFEQNHLDGYSDSDKAYGLYDGNILYSGMLFKKNNNEWELIKTCDKIDFKILNSKSLLLAEHESKHNGAILVNIDNRWEDSTEYEKLGFEKKFNIDPIPKTWSNNIMKLNTIENTENITQLLDSHYNIIWDAGRKNLKKENNVFISRSC